MPPSNEIRSLLLSCLGAGSGVGMTAPQTSDQGLFQQELPYIARAAPKRRREFAAGRRAARAAMAELGLPPAPILRGPQREPLWPDGLTGSIAHCDTLCIAAVSRTHRSLGLDIEEATPLDTDLEETICTPSERAWLDTLSAGDRGLAAKRIFSAKEALFKAQYPVTGQMIGFDAVSLRLTSDQQRFRVDADSSLPVRSIETAQVVGLVLSLCVAVPTGSA